MLKYIKFTFGTFQEKKLRSFLTLVGIVIGIALIVTLISLGQGLEDSIKDQFQQWGINKILVTPGGEGSFFGFAQSGIVLSEKDLEVIKKISGVELASGMIYKIVPLEFKGQRKYAQLTGLPSDESKKVLEDFQNFKVIKGRELREGDKNKVIVGEYLYDGKFFDKKVELGDKLEINGEEFEVVGFMGLLGNPQDDSNSYIPLEKAFELFSEENYNMIFVQVTSEKDVEKIAEDIKKELRKSRNVEEGQEDFTVQTANQIMDSYSNILNIVQAVLIGLAMISIIVGGVGIMNTMFTSVLERTKEIGIMKAIGATQKEIIILFLIEAGVLGLVGGIIGTFFGVIFSKSLELVSSKLGYSILTIHLSWNLIIGAILFSFVAGMISGIIPALRASKLNIVEALRYE
ncbi:hypothetical protein DRN69_04950 [Candidatus Pacearchaeota archaeon]|nr:MAG: hypothetical protein DRN69_04950 [Candidatus Pacearchaeota archaeon]